MKYALVTPSNTIDRVAVNIDPAVGTKPGWSWRPFVEIDPPSISDRLASLKEVMTVEPGQVVKSWEIVRREPTAIDVMDERTRRLALGFDYTFPDARGLHHIGTTEADMIGWDEVTKIAQALVALGQESSLLAIVTNTGTVQITALEWQQILVAAAAFRQPIWVGSFALQAMSPIPADYTNNSYWGGA